MTYRNPAYDASYDYRPHAGAPQRVCLVATTPRSGSSLLAFLCRQTDGLGFPLEYFAPINREIIECRLGSVGDSLHGYAQRLMRIRTSPGGTFAFKLHQGDLADFSGSKGWTAITPTHVLFLERRSRLDQAISLHIASHTNEWIALRGFAMARAAEPRYDREMITATLAMLEQQQGRWEAFLREQGWPVLKLTYEDVLEDCAGTFSKIAGFLEVPAEVPLLQRVELARQGSALNRDWRDRFLSGA